MVSSTALIFVLLAFIPSGFTRTIDRDVIVSKVVDISNQLGSDLIDILGKEDGNFLYSPISISTALSALYVGARGETRKELGKLGYGTLGRTGVSVPQHYNELIRQLESDSDEYKLEVANGLLTQADYAVLEEYKDVLESYYDALLKEVDFSGKQEEAVQEVNNWVREKTHGKITKLVDEIDESTRLMLLNAVYFKGTWQTEFDPEDTEQRPFYNNGGDSSSTLVPTMKIRTKYPYLYDEKRQLRALELPYKGEDVSMVVILPHERDGVTRLVEQLSRDGIDDIVENLAETKVTVHIPKFKLRYSRSLEQDLRSIGVRTLFGADADLSGITGNRDLYVSEIIHKAVVEVNEEGSEAAAVTGVEIVPLSLEIPADRDEFNANHPFIFYVIDKRTMTHLFVGRFNEL